MGLGCDGAEVAVVPGGLQGEQTVWVPDHGINYGVGFFPGGGNGYGYRGINYGVGFFPGGGFGYGYSGGDHGAGKGYGVVKKYRYRGRGITGVFGFGKFRVFRGRHVPKPGGLYKYGEKYDI
ncbi:keratin-associated protein 19-2-like [Callorhinchus milii]|uniref:keratin-associated protein 19-2-like n=1 Tax=Callorhinchus milii TaxID=7868 RepID=UPI001C3F6BB8|nr:keratin-associated protein 19-2-like [Callorhinchus milii]